jgi:hypothetical protein
MHGLYIHMLFHLPVEELYIFLPRQEGLPICLVFRWTKVPDRVKSDLIVGLYNNIILLFVNPRQINISNKDENI